MKNETVPSSSAAFPVLLSAIVTVGIALCDDTQQRSARAKSSEAGETGGTAFVSDRIGKAISISSIGRRRGGPPARRAILDPTGPPDTVQAAPNGANVRLRTV